MNFSIFKFLNKILGKNKFPYYIIFLFSLVSIIWLQGGIIFFWNSKLPFFPYYELTNFTFAWSPYSLGAINLHPDTEVTYFMLYTIFYFISFKSLFLAQQLIISVIFMISGFSSYILLNFIFSYVIKNKNHNIFALIGSLFYMFNYFDDILFYQIHPYWISYSLLPLALYIILKGISKVNSKTELIEYSLFSSFLLELILSFTISWEPIVVYIIFIVIVYLLIFKRRLTHNNSLHLFYFFLMIMLFSFLLNFWWLAEFMHLVNVDAISVNSTVIINGVMHSFLTNGYRLKFWSVIALYPLLYSTKNTNAFTFIGEYYRYSSIFYIISIIFFIVIIFPLLNIKSKNSLLSTHEKLISYFILFMLLFIGVQGFNPVNRIIVIFLKNDLPYIIPYLYGTNYYFIEIPIISIYLLLLPTSIYEIVNFKMSKNSRYINKHLYSKLSISIDRNKKILAIILVIIIIGIFPYYMFTPSATMDYIDGNNHVPSVVKFPPTFEKLLDYVHEHSDGGTTLILPQSSNMFSVNFSKRNTFINAESPSFLTGSETLLCEPLLTQQIDSFISRETPNNTHFSIFLNDINVKYIIVDKAVDSFIPGYGFLSNISEITNYISSRSNISLIGSFGPLLLYKNKNYNSIIIAGTYSYFNPTITEPYGKFNIMPNLKNFSISEPYGNYTHNAQYLNFSANLSRYNPVHFVNTEPLNVNISNYNYLIIKTGYMTNDSQLLVYTNAFFINGAKGHTGITLLRPMNVSTGHIGSKCYLSKSNTTYVLPLYQYGSNEYASPVNQNGTILNYIHFGIETSGNTNFTYTINMSKIYFARYISSSFNTYEIMSKNPESIFGNYSYLYFKTEHVNIDYKEISPVSYEIFVYNASTPFALLFKQDYNQGWELRYNNKILNIHVDGDEYANVWLVNKTGNYTLHLNFAPQKTISVENYTAIFTNLILLSSLVAICFYMRRKRR